MPLHPCASFSALPAVYGVPAVLEQKTTILWKCLSFLVSLKDSPGWVGGYTTNGSGGGRCFRGVGLLCFLDVRESEHPSP